MSLEYFFAYETGGAPAQWTITDCEKRSTDGSVEQRPNYRTCVQADFELNHGGALTVLVRVEGSKNGRSRGGSIVQLTITDLTGSVRQVPSLDDLPKELRRWPSRTPKDVPLPEGDS